MSGNNSEEQRSLPTQSLLYDPSIHEENGIDDNIIDDLPEGLIPEVDSDSTDDDDDDDDSDLDLSDIIKAFELAFPLSAEEGFEEAPEPEPSQHQPFIGPLNLQDSDVAFSSSDEEWSVGTPELERLQQQPQFNGPYLQFCLAPDSESEDEDEAVAGPSSGSTHGQSNGSSQIVGDGGQNNIPVCPVCQQITAASAELRQRWMAVVTRITSVENELRSID